MTLKSSNAAFLFPLYLSVIYLMRVDMIRFFFINIINMLKLILLSLLGISFLCLPSSSYYSLYDVRGGRNANMQGDLVSYCECSKCCIVYQNKKFKLYCECKTGARSASLVKLSLSVKYTAASLFQVLSKLRLRWPLRGASFLSPFYRLTFTFTK